MAWDKSQPDGSVLTANLVDDRIVENNKALEAALDAEHVFATGSTQHGRHKFGVGVVAARDGISQLLHNGAIWFITDNGSGNGGLGEIVDGNAILSVYDGPNSRWIHVDARMLLEVRNAWLKSQHGYYETLSIVGTPVGTVASDWANTNFFKLNATSDFTLSNPTNMPTDGAGGVKPGGTWIYEITQDLGAPRLITLGSKFRTQFGVTLQLSPTNSALDILICTLRSDGFIHAELARDSS